MRGEAPLGSWSSGGSVTTVPVVWSRPRPGRRRSWKASTHWRSSSSGSGVAPKDLPQAAKRWRAQRGWSTSTSSAAGTGEEACHAPRPAHRHRPSGDELGESRTGARCWAQRATKPEVVPPMPAQGIAHHDRLVVVPPATTEGRGLLAARRRREEAAGRRSSTPSGWLVVRGVEAAGWRRLGGGSKSAARWRRSRPRFCSANSTRCTCGSRWRQGTASSAKPLLQESGPALSTMKSPLGPPGASPPAPSPRRCGPPRTAG